jgi:transaldolase
MSETIDRPYTCRVDLALPSSIYDAKTKTCSQDGCDVSDETLNMAVDRLAVNLGKELVGLIDGRVITEVDIRLSYDTNASVERGVWYVRVEDLQVVYFVHQTSSLTILHLVHSSIHHCNVRRDGCVKG